MYKQLFCASEVLQGCLLHVRTICEDACSSSTGKGALSFISVSRTKTYTLDDFCDLQKKKKKKVEGELHVLYDNVVRIVFESCAVSITMTVLFVFL